MFKDALKVSQKGVTSKRITSKGTTSKRITSKGISKANKDKLPNVKVKARVIIPDGYKNYGYLAYKNFDSLLNWNRYIGLEVTARLIEGFDFDDRRTRFQFTKYV